MPNEVTVGDGVIVGTYPSGDGRTINIWNFNVIVNGQTGGVRYEALSTTSEEDVAQEVAEYLSEGDSPIGTDGNTGDFPDGQGQDDGLGDDDAGDTVVAGNNGGFGESV